MRPLVVVVPDVGTQEPDQMPPAKHQHPVKALRTHGRHPPLGIGVRPQRLYRSSDDLRTLTTEHFVEGTAELGVMVTQHKPDCRCEVPPRSQRDLHQIRKS